MPTDASAGSKPADRTERHWLARLIWATTACIALQPIANEDLWWQIARGRSVAEGSIAPSRSLLSVEEGAESDWLGGVVFFVAFSGLDVAGLMIFKMLAVGLFIFLLLCEANRKVCWSSAAVIAATLLAVQGSIEPSPVLFDLLGIAICWRLMQRWRRRSAWTLTIAVVLAVTAWANLSAGVIWAIPVLIAALSRGADAAQKAPQWKKRVIIVLAVIAACCATPRGLWSLGDQLRLLLAGFDVSVSGRLNSMWLSPFDSGHPVEAVLFAGVAIGLAMMLVVGRAPLAEIGVAIAVQILGWSSMANLSPAATLTALMLLGRVRFKPPLVVAAERSAKSPGSRFASTIGPCVVGAVIVVAVVMLAGGFWPGANRRLGWGLHRSLDLRLIERDLAGLKLDGTAHCDGIRAAGMLSMIRPGTIRVYDIPSRALVGGRYREYVLINHDILTSRRMRYRRSDGTNGGWWIPLQRRKTRLLVVSAANGGLIGALEATLWKPMTIDAPVLTFAQAGDPLCTPRIVETLKQRHLVQWGPWVYVPSRNMPSSFDLIYIMTGQRQIAGDLELSSLFRSMGLYRAALRVIAPLLREQRRGAVQAEFARCQLKMAWQERVLCGRASSFRALAWRSAVPPAESSAGETMADVLRRPDLFDAQSNRWRIDKRWEKAMVLYRQGRPAKAAEQMTALDAESLYARASLLLEAGQLEPARQLLQRLEQRFPDHPINPVSRRILDETE